MKSLFTILSVFLFGAMMAQPLQLKYHWDDPTIPGSAAYDNAYNECWGFVQNDREFAVIGSTLGTHIFDITDLNNIDTVAFIQGKVANSQIIHRDYHDYDGYLYIVADEGASSLQIVDITGLPNSYSVVYDDDDILQRSHNIFIDTANAILYACAANNLVKNIPLGVYSLANPELPVDLGTYSNIGGFGFSHVHDAYIGQDNLLYLNAGPNGFCAVNTSDPNNLTLESTLVNYTDKGYNHSGWTTEDGNYYFMLDEDHGYDIKVVDVSDPTDVNEIASFNSNVTSNSIAHNVIIRGNYAYVSYYYDGLWIYDISDPANPVSVADYDTYMPTNTGSYKGNWGVYPFPVGTKVIASDMQSGLYVFDFDPSLLGTGVNEINHNQLGLNVFPNPSNGNFELMFNADKNETARIVISNFVGQTISETFYQVLDGNNSFKNIDNKLEAGAYLISVYTESGVSTVSFVVK